MTTQAINWSLQNELKSRKVQGVLRTIENQQVARTKTQAERQLRLHSRVTAMPEAASNAPKVRRVRKVQPSIVKQAAAPAPDTHLTKIHKRTIILAGIIVLAGGTLLILLAMLLNNQPTPQSAAAPLPVVSVNNVVDHLKEAGLPIANLRTFAAPDPVWTAKAEIQFDIQRGTDKGIFIVLSYESADKAGLDGYSASTSPKFKNWKVMQYSNILVLSSPDSAKPIYAEMANNMTQYLIAPYRSFIPTTK